MRFYQVDLPGMYRGKYSARQISIFVKYLPRGAQTWQLLGGPQAITQETEDLWIVAHLLSGIAWQNAGSKGQPPKPREYPKGVLEQRAEMNRMLSQAEAFRRKHHK
jgi:hypothetical protein